MWRISMRLLSDNIPRHCEERSNLIHNALFEIASFLAMTKLKMCNENIYGIKIIKFTFYTEKK
jgi:hypothetical protein